MTKWTLLKVVEVQQRAELIYSILNGRKIKPFKKRIFFLRSNQSISSLRAWASFCLFPVLPQGSISCYVDEDA